MAHASGSITIREAEKRDSEKLAEFVVRLKQVNEELDPMYMVREDLEEVAREYIEKSFDNPDVVMLVAEAGDEVVGMVRAKIVDRLFYEPRLEGLVTDIYVHPLYRRRGVAKQLLDALEKRLAEKGITLLAAEHPPNNRIAEKFFAKEGFKPLLMRVYRKIG